jgi:hypothetical protein
MSIDAVVIGLKGQQSKVLEVLPELPEARKRVSNFPGAVAEARAYFDCNGLLAMFEATRG